MQRTQNYNLCQWAAEDRILRSDFNADNQKIDTALAGLAGSAVKTATGSYVGTGTYGIANKITLQFDFAPVALVILAAHNASSVFQMIALRGMPRVHTTTGSSTNDFDSTALIWTENSVSFYSDANDSSRAVPAHLNINGKTYYYLALG